MSCKKKEKTLCFCPAKVCCQVGKSEQSVLPYQALLFFSSVHAFGEPGNEAKVRVDTCMYTEACIICTL